MRIDLPSGRSSCGRLLVAVLAVLLLIGAGACSRMPTGGSGSGDRPPGSGATAHDLVVQENGRELARLTMAQLQALPQVEIATPQSRGAQFQKGATVRSVLDAAGATGVHSVRVEGRDPAQTLTTAELADLVILNVTKRNTLKLAGARLDASRWVRDVTTLVVNP